MWRLAGGIAAGAAMLAAGAAGAASNWCEARTDHFRVVMQGTPQAVADYATRLERYDRAMRVVRDMPERPGDRDNPVRVYVVPSVETVAQLCRGEGHKAACGNVAGFYTPHIGQSVAFTPRHGMGNGDKFDLSAQAVLFHEYAHHFMYGNAAAAYPAWFTEGFAEFNATTELTRDGGAVIGRPPLYRAYSLVAGIKLPMARLLTANGEDLQPDYRESLYARGWLLVDYLTFDKKRGGQLPRYLRLVNEGKPSLVAAKEAFGDLGKLESDVDYYLTGGRMYVVPLPADRIRTSAPTVRELGAGEAAMLPVIWQSKRGVNKVTAPAVLADARRRAAPYPADPAVQDALAEAEYDAGQDDAAEAAADRALTADPQDVTAMLYKGRTRLRRAERAQRGDTPAWHEARSWFVKANRLTPDDARPLVLYYTSFLAAGVRPTANSVTGLMRAFELSPQAAELHYLVARQYLLDGDAATARKVLAPVAFDPHRGQDSLAARVVKQIDAQDIAGAHTALAGDGGGNAGGDGD